MARSKAMMNFRTWQLWSMRSQLNVLHAKFEVLNEADGNIEMNDKSEEIVYMKAYDSANKLIKGKLHFE